MHLKQKNTKLCYSLPCIIDTINIKISGLKTVKGFFAIKIAFSELASTQAAQKHLVIHGYNVSLMQRFQVFERRKTKQKSGKHLVLVFTPWQNL